MARYVATVDTSWDREQAFDYLADFASVSDWDPGIERAKLIAGTTRLEGARFEVVSSFMGREIPLEYETLEVDRPNKVVLRAETGTIVSLDVMTFDLRPEGGTLVTYDADLTLKGPLRVFDLGLRLAFQRIGDKAKAGLESKLAERPPGEAGAAKS